MEILITGATGLLGRELVQKLNGLQEFDCIHLLVRDLETANEAFSKIGKSKLCLVKGDITQKRLGLDPSQINQLENVTEVYHLAALVSLGTQPVLRKKIFEVNVEGTRNLLDFFSSLPNLSALYFVSTAYACGYAKGTVPEDWIPMPSSFRNHYEESKWHAEQAIHEYVNKTHLRYVIVRPSIVLSSSYKDITAMQHSIYLFALLVYQATKRGEMTGLRILGFPSAGLNFVLEENLLDSMLVIRSSDARGVYNIASSQEVSVELLMQNICAGLGINSIRFEPSLQLAEMNAIERAMHEALGPFLPYFQGASMHWENARLGEMPTPFQLKEITPEWAGEHIKKYCRNLLKK